MRSGCVRADVCRLFRRLDVWIAVLWIAGFVVGSNLSNLPLREFLTVDYLIDTMTEAGWFRNLIFILAAVPFACSYCRDVSGHFREAVLCRVDVEQYAWSKVLCNAAVSFLVTFTGFMMSAAVFRIFFSFSYYEKFGEINASGIYGELLSGTYPVLFVLIRVVLFSCGAMLWSTVALMVSAWKSDVFVVVSVPYLASYLVERLERGWQSWMSIDICISGEQMIPGGWRANLLYGILFMILMTLLAGRVFVWKVKRSVRGG